MDYPGYWTYEAKEEGQGMCVTELGYREGFGTRGRIALFPISHSWDD